MCRLLGFAGSPGTCLVFLLLLGCGGGLLQICLHLCRVRTARLSHALPQHLGRHVVHGLHLLLDKAMRQACHLPLHVGHLQGQHEALGFGLTFITAKKSVLLNSVGTDARAAPVLVSSLTDSPWPGGIERYVRHKL